MGTGVPSSAFTVPKCLHSEARRGLWVVVDSVERGNGFVIGDNLRTAPEPSTLGGMKTTMAVSILEAAPVDGCTTHLLKGMWSRALPAQISKSDRPMPILGPQNR